MSGMNRFNTGDTVYVTDKHKVFKGKVKSYNKYVSGYSDYEILIEKQVNRLPSDVHSCFDDAKNSLIDEAYEQYEDHLKEIEEQKEV